MSNFIIGSIYYQNNKDQNVQKNLTYEIEKVTIYILLIYGRSFHNQLIIDEDTACTRKNRVVIIKCIYLFL